MNTSKKEAKKATRPLIISHEAIKFETAICGNPGGNGGGNGNGNNGYHNGYGNGNGNHNGGPSDGKHSH